MKFIQLSKLALILLLLGGFFGSASAQKPNIPKVYFEDFADHSIIWAENQLAIDSTLSFHLKEITNATPDRTEPIVITVKPGQKLALVHFKPNDISRPWRYDYEFHWTWGAIEARHDPKAVYRLPFAKGSKFKVVQGFNTAFTHQGELAYAVDFNLPEGTPVHCARQGVVVYTEDRFSRGGLDKEFWYKVNVVLVRHQDGTIGEYAHVKNGGIVVKVGQEVGPGDLLAYSGNVGYSAAPHLHFVVYRAVTGYTRQSFPMKFLLKNGQAAQPVEGEIYVAP